MLALLSPFAAQSALAQEAAEQPNAAAPSESASSGLEEVIVTANRRKEYIQDVPIAITAITASQLQNSGIDSSAALATAVPGLTVQSSGAGFQPHLRGVGNSAFATGQENSVATYVDGVYLASLSGALFKFNNIQAIEVIKGPQGTLFGRNATGGVINVTTKDPSHEFGGTGSVSYGNYSTVSTDAYLTGGITENLAADIAVYYSHQGDGWGKNLFDGSEAATTEDFAVRSKWLLTPGTDDRLTVALDYAETNSTALFAWRGYEDHPSNWGPGDPQPFGQPYVFPGDYWDIAVPFTPKADFEQWGGSLQYEHDFSVGTLTSITAYRQGTQFALLSPSPVPTDAQQAPYENRERQFSQELRLSSSDASVIKWVAGLYYLTGKAGYHPFSILGSAVVQPPLQSLNFDVDQTTDSYAAFGQATVPVPWLGDTNLTAGLRWTSERRGVEGHTFLGFIPSLGIPDLVVPGSETDTDKTFEKLTWRLTLDHHFTDDVLGYISYNRGFKSGVYNTVPPGGADAQPVNPEILDAYEIGIKTDLYDRQLRINAAAFYYDYSDIQVQIYTPIAVVLQNGAKAEIYGLDLDVDASITENLALKFGLETLHSEFASFPSAVFLIPQSVAEGGGNVGVSGSAKGNDLPYTPDTALSISANYTVPISYGTLDFSATYAYASRWFAGPDNIAEAPESNMINAQAGWTLPDGRTRIGLWGKNLKNQAVPMIISSGANPGGGDQAVYAPPRTYGIAVEHTFGGS